MSVRTVNGPVAALMDEFERAARELIGLIGRITDEEFNAVRDEAADDPNCRSIATVTRHVVDAGYAEADEFRSAFGAESGRPAIAPISREECLQALRGMVDYMAATLEGHWGMPPEENEACLITTPWGTVYTFEQLFEHAIVHVLRHRRQIERWRGDLP